jgi:hypothetical protein
MSRRSALKRFLGAVFGLGGASLLPRRMSADDPSIGKRCVDACRCLEENAEGDLPVTFGRCVSFCISRGGPENVPDLANCLSGISGT